MVNNEFWRIVASGLFDGLLDDLIAVTSRDGRQLMIENGAFSGKLWRACYDSLGYVVDQRSINECWNYVADPVYNPQLRDDVPPMAEGAGASGGNTLVADVPPVGFTVQVYSWDFTEFTLLGTLAENSQPGAGNYVLALVDDENENNVGLPSLFLELTS